MRSTIKAGAVMLALLGSAASAGPPYETDDPAPTDPGHWEIYVFSAVSGARGNLDGSTGFDLNFGAAPGVQLTATLPLDFADDGAKHAGAGDVELGIKYRFLHREEAEFAMAIFPRLILPTAGSRFGSGKFKLLLPAWAQKDFGPWSLFGGGGYTINPGAGNRDYWQGNVALTRTLSPRLSIGAELGHRGPDADRAGSTTDLGLGGIYKLNGPFSILVSAGPGFEHHVDGAQVHAYAALGVAF